ncbi:MAG: hypothetical protein V1891_03140 [bacterium]
MRFIKIIFIFFIVAFLPVFIARAAGDAEEMMRSLNTTGAKGFLEAISKESYKTDTVGESSLIDLIGLIIFILISLLGLFFVIKLIVAGYLWMTASGNEEQVGKSKSIIFSSIIGLVIVLSAFVLSWWVLEKFETKSIEWQQGPPAPLS